MIAGAWEAGFAERLRDFFGFLACLAVDDAALAGMLLKIILDGFHLVAGLLHFKIQVWPVKTGDEKFWILQI